jgi:hypothetical protein
MAHTGPTPEMIDALQEFANVNGRTWKSKLSMLWETARAPAVLMDVRNQLGPTWLYDVCKVKPQPGSKRGAVRFTVDEIFRNPKGWLR